MNGTIFSQSALQRRAAWLALFAILLIVVAPLISVSLQKDPMSAMPGMHHAMPMGESHDGMSGHEMVMMHGADSASQPAHSMPVDHAEACGYCVLLAHVPGLLFALALVLRHDPAAYPPAGFSPGIKTLALLPWLYPETRAPPRLSAFSL